ncbi:sigma factor-like helix-turn-helix DNA-binding protein [Priestia filamentosa]|uniref:sigma factor-like helix-turn-helix DNA-binding protein n=1 Tax=Priestia filamentosa TaxID=1402861 RepID=UPI003D2CEFD9
MLNTCTERQFTKYIIMNLTGKRSRLQKYYTSKDYYEQNTLNKCKSRDDNEDLVYSIAETRHTNLEEYVVLKTTIEQIMRQLKPLEYQIIKKIYWEDKKIQEIAQEMDMARSSIFRIKNQAFNKIRNFLEDCETFNLKSVF